MKKFLLLIITVLLLTSCAQPELSPFSENAINSGTSSQANDTVIQEHREVIVSGDVSDETAYKILFKMYEPAQRAIYALGFCEFGNYDSKTFINEIKTQKGIYTAVNKEQTRFGLYVGDYEWMQSYLNEYFTEDYITTNFSFEFPSNCFYSAPSGNIYVSEMIIGGIYEKDIKSAVLTKNETGLLRFEFSAFEYGGEYPSKYQGECYIEISLENNKWKVSDYKDDMTFMMCKPPTEEEIVYYAEDSIKLVASGIISKNNEKNDIKRYEEVKNPAVFIHPGDPPIYVGEIPGTPSMDYLANSKNFENVATDQFIKQVMENILDNNVVENYIAID